MPANTPPVPGTRFTVDWLNDLATCGDVAADKVIVGLAKRRSTTDVERQNEFPDLTRRIWADVDLLQPPIRDFVMAGDEVAPHIEADKVTHAQAFFEEHGVAVITALFYAALPEAYLGQRGVQVLDLTGELVQELGAADPGDRPVPAQRSHPRAVAGRQDHLAVARRGGSTRGAPRAADPRCGPLAARRRAHHHLRPAEAARTSPRNPSGPPAWSTSARR